MEQKRSKQLEFPIIPKIFKTHFILQINYARQIIT